MQTLNALRDLTLEWSHDRGILTNGKVTTQALKLVSEVGELCDNVGKGKNIKDDIGDCLVVLTNIAGLSNLTLEECWAFAYDEIKDRKGFLNEHGNFIKDTDPSYTQLKLEFEGSIEPKEFIEVLVGNYDPSYEAMVVNIATNMREYKYIYEGKSLPNNTPTLFKNKELEHFFNFIKTVGSLTEVQNG